MKDSLLSDITPGNLASSTTGTDDPLKKTHMDQAVVYVAVKD